MGLGIYTDLGFRGTDDQEVDAIDFIADGLPGDLTDVSDFAIDFGPDDELTIGEETTVTFTLSGLDGVTPISAGVTITGTYIGQDESGSPHIDPQGISAIMLETDTPINIPIGQQILFAALGDMRVTNDAGFPESGDGDYPDPSATPLPLCFAAGTLIATPAGPRPVEELRPGDLVLTEDGRQVAAKWIGRQVLSTRFSGERARPVRVAQGALGQGVPDRDLVLTADHALVIDGLAINAGALVNGVTITLEPRHALPERASYYHVETAAHDVILANGAPAESFIDYIGRAGFENYQEYLDLYGEPEVITEMGLPRISSARLVPRTVLDRLTPARSA